MNYGRGVARVEPLLPAPVPVPVPVPVPLPVPRLLMLPLLIDELPVPVPLPVPLPVPVPVPELPMFDPGLMFELIGVEVVPLVVMVFMPLVLVFMFALRTLTLVSLPPHALSKPATRTQAPKRVLFIIYFSIVRPEGPVQSSQEFFRAVGSRQLDKMGLQRNVQPHTLAR